MPALSNLHLQKNSYHARRIIIPEEQKRNYQESQSFRRLYPMLRNLNLLIAIIDMPKVDHTAMLHEWIRYPIRYVYV